MSYSQPPGVIANSKLTPYPSLPARPPASITNMEPAYTSSRPAPSTTFGGFAPRSVATAQPYNSYQQSYAQQPSNTYGTLHSQEPTYAAAPQIRNPFALPNTNGSASQVYDEDPEMAAQIAQWQSAYASKDSSSSVGYTGAVRKYANTGEGFGSATSANAAPLGGGSNMSVAAMNSAAHNDTGIATVVNDAKTNTKTVVRSGGGTTWTDSSLLEWDPSHFRLFVGNLAGEVTDESLHKAFSRWPSVQKARVIRDKRTTKSKGYGFVSFSDGDDFFQAARDMQGKYIGSHPVLLRRSTTEIKAVNPKDQRNNKHKGKRNTEKTRSSGVHKQTSKTKGGLKLLG